MKAVRCETVRCENRLARSTPVDLRARDCVPNSAQHLRIHCTFLGHNRTMASTRFCGGARHKNGRSGRPSAIDPVVLEPPAEPTAEQGDDSVSAAGTVQNHAGAFEPRAPMTILQAASMTPEPTRSQALCAERRIAHPDPRCVQSTPPPHWRGFRKFVGAGLQGSRRIFTNASTLPRSSRSRQRAIQRWRALGSLGNSWEDSSHSC